MAHAQVPLRLSWAMTYYKAQGNEFDRVIVDLQGVHSQPGHAYTALSRARSLAGLRVINGRQWVSAHIPDVAISSVRLRMRVPLLLARVLTFLLLSDKRVPVCGNW